MTQLAITERPVIVYVDRQRQSTLFDDLQMYT